MATASSKTLLLGLCMFAILHLHQTAGKPASRNRRYIDNGNEPLEASDYNSLDRDARSGGDQGDPKLAYPAFPGNDDWWYSEPSTAPPYISPPSSTTTVYRGVEDENESEIEEPEEKLHQKVVPWFKKHWGRTKNFFKKHYETVSNSIG